MFTHIKSHLPDIMREIKDKIADIESRLVNLGPSMPSEPREKTHLLWNMVTEFINEFNIVMTGKQDSKKYQSTSLQPLKEIKGGARIKEIFEKLYEDYTRNFKATEDYTDGDIERAIQLHEGDQMAGF